MDNKEVKDKLQHAYKSMLEHIGELVEKEKKPLAEAFEEAEEKISEWSELSREEVNKVSDELKSNLSDWGEASNRLNESLKETFAFDKAYLVTNIWESLSKVADKTVVDFNEFTEDLQKHMAVNATSYSEQQKNWLNDSMQWKSSYDNALRQLDELRAGVRKQIMKTNRYSKNVSKDLGNQEEHDLLAQMNQEITSSVDEIYQKLIGDKS